MKHGVKIFIISAFIALSKTVAAEEECVIDYSSSSPSPTPLILNLLKEKGYKTNIQKDETFEVIRNNQKFWMKMKKELSVEEATTYENKFFLFMSGFKPMCTIETSSFSYGGSSSSNSKYQCSISITLFNTYQDGKLVQILPLSSQFKNTQKFNSEEEATNDLLNQIKSKMPECSKIKVNKKITVPTTTELDPAGELKNDAKKEVIDTLQAKEPEKTNDVPADKSNTISK